jgi:type I restriction enzyme M protein
MRERESAADFENSGAGGREREALDENPGEHFTPRDVVHLMADLLIAGDEARIGRPGVVLTVYDPCCGSGGMLTITKDHINGTLDAPGINADAELHLFGQEVNPETFAVCKSDLFMKSAQGRDAENIAFGSVLSNDRHTAHRFDYLITNPPYGKDWKRDEAAVRDEHARGASGRFGAGLPRISDGQLLFLQHMLGRMHDPAEGGIPAPLPRHILEGPFNEDPARLVGAPYLVGVEDDRPDCHLSGK